MVVARSLAPLRNLVITGSVAFAALGTTVSAFAQCSVPTGSPNIFNSGDFSVPASATGSALASTIGNVNTAFLSQQGSAFVSAPPNPTPNQPGGGVWARGIGGEVDIKSSSTSSTVGTRNDTGAVVNNTTTACNNSQHDNFAGVQVGADIARLNWSGWNIHLGTTAGYLGSKSNDSFGFNNTVQVPFWGTYLVATHGRFFADLLIRQEFYNINLNNAAFTFYNQPVNAHGYSISTSAGYNADLGNGWFVEPSAGFIYSKTSIDNFTYSGTTALPISATLATDDVNSEIGRLSLRVGKTIETQSIIWQPFASASVYHEFAGNVVNHMMSPTNGAFFLPAGAAVTFVPATVNQTTSTTRVGTYGQYSLGLAAQVVNTGWLGFVRVDYRDGDNIQGWTGNAGIRYQFTPEMIASVMPVKVKAPRPYVAPTNWTGFYVGGFGGAAAGRTDIGFVGDPVDGNRPWTIGGLGGLEAGYNYQFANKWVVGVEGDIAAANIHGGRTAGTTTGLGLCPPVGGCPAPNGVPQGAFTAGFNPFFMTVQDRTNWQATLTGRLGYAWERTLFYVKGGVAFEDSSTTVACSYGPTATLNNKVCLNQAGVVTAGFTTPYYTRVGGTVGFGTEFDLGHNWSAKSEYDFMSFGSHTATASDGTTQLTDKSWISRVTVGVNYKFTPGIVVAKY